MEASLPSIYSAAGASFSGANALAADFMRPDQGDSDITYYMFDGKTTYNSLQVQVKRSFARTFTCGLSYMLSKAVTTISTDGICTSNITNAAGSTGSAIFNDLGQQHADAA